jgi:branched-chain amino acid aminotransferase
MMITDTLNITLKKVGKSRISELEGENLSFGKHFSDHMFIADYEGGNWKNFRIIPFENLLISPAMAALHYGQAIFEGMKAYKNKSGEVLLYRPQTHLSRLNKSAERMAMPLVPEEVFTEGIIQLLKTDRQWVPSAEGSSLYIRPLYIATDEYLGVHPSENYKLIIITSPVGAYYSDPVKVLVETNYIRAVEGGVGYVKASGNYGRSLHPTRLAQQRGYHQVIWTDARHHRYLEESGTMNVMFVIDDVLITPPLGDTILAGITRDSVLTLARDWGMKVEERKISVDEVIEAHQNGTLREAFGTGTAATIAHIAMLGFDGRDYELPPVKDRPFSLKVGKALDDIRRGNTPDKFGWILTI